MKLLDYVHKFFFNPISALLVASRGFKWDKTTNGYNCKLYFAFLQHLLYLMC